MNVEEIKCFRCTKCYKVYIDKEFAEQCCITNSCNKCGKEVSKPYVLCGSCREKKQFNKAKKILYKDYNLPFFYDNVNDQYFNEFEEMKDCCDNEDLPCPEYAYACNEISFNLDIESSIENALGEMHEDFDDIVDEQELKDFIDYWNNKQTGKSYYPDFSKVIIFDTEDKYEVTSKYFQALEKIK